MPRSVNVPDLATKLALLLRHDTAITTKTALAEKLGVSPSLISKWESGGDYPKRRGRVSADKLERLRDLFNIDHKWMMSARETDESRDHFRARLEAALHARPLYSGWENMFRAAEISACLAIKRLEKVPDDPALRGLRPEHPVYLVMGEHFRLGERVFVDLRLEAPWEHANGEPLAHVAVLSVNAIQVQCLRPSCELANVHEAYRSRITIPEDIPQDALRVTLPVGQHSLIAIVTKQPLSSVLREELMQPGHPSVPAWLPRLAYELEAKPKSEWYILRSIYYVDDVNEGDQQYD